MNALLLPVLLLAEDKKPPEANDVVAGWTAFWIFLGLIVAVALLCWSLVRQLKKVNNAKDAGVYGDVPERAADEAAPTVDQAPAQTQSDDPGGDPRS